MNTTTESKQSESLVEKIAEYVIVQPKHKLIENAKQLLIKKSIIERISEQTQKNSEKLKALNNFFCESVAFLISEYEGAKGESPSLETVRKEAPSKNISAHTNQGEKESWQETFARVWDEKQHIIRYRILDTRAFTEILQNPGVSINVKRIYNFLQTHQQITNLSLDDTEVQKQLRKNAHEKQPSWCLPFSHKHKQTIMTNPTLFEEFGAHKEAQSRLKNASVQQITGNATNLEMQPSRYGSNISDDLNKYDAVLRLVVFLWLCIEAEQGNVNRDTLFNPSS